MRAEMTLLTKSYAALPQRLTFAQRAGCLKMSHNAPMETCIKLLRA
jgi:hypothetical protein